MLLPDLVSQCMLVSKATEIYLVDKFSGLVSSCPLHEAFEFFVSKFPPSKKVSQLQSFVLLQLVKYASIIAPVKLYFLRVYFAAWIWINS